MLHFARALKRIGDLYYAGQEELNALSRGQTQGSQGGDAVRDAFLGRLGETRAIRGELENARLRLDKGEAFSPELEILARYDEILRQEIAANGGAPVPPQAAQIPPETGGTVSGELGELQNRVSGLFREISLVLGGEETGALALAPFSFRDGREAPLLGYLDESAIVSLSGNPHIRLVERSRLEAVREEQRLQLDPAMDTGSAIRIGKLLGARYIITGQVIPLESQVIVFGRLIQVETGEILNAAQVFIERRVIQGLL
jgi:TolB-like protein